MEIEARVDGPAYALQQQAMLEAGVRLMRVLLPKNKIDGLGFGVGCLLYYSARI